MSLEPIFLEADDDCQSIPDLAADVLVKLQDMGLYAQGTSLVDVVGAKPRLLTKSNDLKYYVIRTGLVPKKQLTAVVADIGSNPYKTEGFQQLERVTTQPTFRPDFTLVPVGYDHATHLLYQPTDELTSHRFNLKATRKDAVAALAKLRYLVQDFPFADEASRTNTIGALLTLITRHAIPEVVPGWALNGANQFSQNVGKGKIFKALVSIAFDSDVKTTTIPPTPTQMLQTLSAEAKNGSAYVVFDDIASGHRLESNDLNAFLTADSWNCKLPGTIETIQVPVRLMVLFNGNDLKTSVDLCNRLFWSELYHEDTQNRDVNQFAIYRDHQLDFESYLKLHRLELLDAAVTMVLAWSNAGRPERKASSPLVKYGAWERIIGGILEYAGATDFLANQKAKAEAADTKTQDILAFIAAVVKLHPDVERSHIAMDSIIPDMMPNGRLRDLLPDLPRSTTEHGIKVSLGRYLKAIEGRRFGKHKVRTWTGAGNKARLAFMLR